MPGFSNLLPTLRGFLMQITELESKGADLRGEIEHLLESLSGEGEITGMLSRSKEEARRRKETWDRDRMIERGNHNMEQARQQAISDGTAIREDREAAIGD
jgi:hypothetical protein